MNRLVERARKHRFLLENFGYLSALQVFNLVFPILTYPYLVRVLRPESYGKVLFAQGIIAYCSVLVNFGFQSSAPRDVAVLRTDRRALSELISSIFAVKLCLLALALMTLVIAVELTSSLASDRWLYYVSFGGVSTPLLFPDWYFQGIERMRNITLIQFGVRILNLVGIFAFVRGPADYMVLAALNSACALAGGIAGVGVLLSHGIEVVVPSWSRVREAADRSFPLFLSNIFASLADKGGTLVVGSALGPVAVSYYNLGEKLTSLGATVFYNVGNTIYPRLAQSRDKPLSRKLTRLVLLSGLMASLLLWLTAPLVIRVFAGPELAPAISIVRWMTPYIFLAAMGPLLANVLLIENRHRDLFPNTVISAGFYVAALATAWALDVLTETIVAVVFVAAIAVRNADRYLIVRRHGLTDWLHGATPEA